MIRIMGLDFGSKTVGVAVSDPLGITAQGIEIVRRTSENKLRKTLARIEELVTEYEVTEIVLGFPKNMNNTIGERAEKSLAFKEMLERRTGLPVVMWDERLTTVAANRTLIEGGVRRENRKDYVDMLAAVYICRDIWTAAKGHRMNKRIEFCPDGENETVGFFVVEETRIAGVSYLLVTESEDDEEAEAYILKDLSEDGETEARYVFVEDDQELEAVSKIFAELLEDVDLEL